MLKIFKHSLYLLEKSESAAMIGQPKINKFFQRKTVSGKAGSDTPTITPLADQENQDQMSGSKAALKRKRAVNDNGDDDGTENSPVSKAAVVEIPKPHVTRTPATAAVIADGSGDKRSPRAEENRLHAKMILVSKQTSGLVTNVGPSWFTALEAEFSKPYFLKLAKFVEEERKKYTVYPPADEVFAWSRMTPISEIKVVIIGQDPYHGPGQAHGLCFSVQKGIALPPSLENMYKELTTDITGFTSPGHGSLVGWAQQGVLLLNAVLTVRAHSANSHKDNGWELFTDAVIAWLNANTSGTVFVLWGSYAQKKGARINRSKHHVLQGVHPSPLSAYRGFFGCKHFSRCNELLETQGKTPVDWTRFV